MCKYRLRNQSNRSLDSSIYTEIAQFRWVYCDYTKIVLSFVLDFWHVRRDVSGDHLPTRDNCTVLWAGLELTVVKLLNGSFGERIGSSELSCDHYCECSNRQQHNDNYNDGEYNVEEAFYSIGDGLEGKPLDQLIACQAIKNLSKYKQ